MSDSVKIALIVAVAGLAGPLLLAWITYVIATRTAAQAARAAALLLAANERVAKATDQTNQKLEVIHTLVNSNLTAAMLAELSATEAGLALMREMVADRLSRGIEPTPDAVARIRTTETRVAELRAQVHDRQTQTKVAEEQLGLHGARREAQDHVQSP